MAISAASLPASRSRSARLSRRKSIGAMRVSFLCLQPSRVVLAMDWTQRQSVFRVDADRFEKGGPCFRTNSSCHRETIVFQGALGFRGFSLRGIRSGSYRSPWRIIVRMQWAPRTSQLWGIRLFFGLRRTRLSTGWGFGGRRPPLGGPPTSDASRGRFVQWALDLFGLRRIWRTKNFDFGGSDGVRAQPRPFQRASYHRKVAERMIHFAWMIAEDEALLSRPS